jgi:D-alanyl-D-alanine carboxypeptidase
MCGPHRKRPAAEDEDASFANLPSDSAYAVFISSLRAPAVKGAALLQDASQLGEPVIVYTGPPRKLGDPLLATANPKPVKPASRAATKPATAALIPTSPTAASGKGKAAKPRGQATVTTSKPPTTPAPKTAITTPEKPAQKSAQKSATKTSQKAPAQKPKAEQKQ